MNIFKFAFDFHKELEPISFKWYLRGLLKSLLFWPGLIGFAFIVPVIGWLFIPLIPFFPFVYPFIDRFAVIRKRQKLIDKTTDAEFIERIRKNRER